MSEQSLRFLLSRRQWLASAATIAALPGAMALGGCAGPQGAAAGSSKSASLGVVGGLVAEHGHPSKVSEQAILRVIVWDDPESGNRLSLIHSASGICDLRIRSIHAPAGRPTIKKAAMPAAFSIPSCISLA